MKLELLNTSVVVVAQEHNPTILHPAFLAAEKIVPAEWELAAPPICTPAFSIVKYGNGIVFTVESNRLSVTDESPSGKVADSKVPKLALAYVEKLPHVHYTAVGVNLSGFVPCDAPEVFLIARFLKEGPWNGAERRVKAFTPRFVYPVADGILRIGCDGGTLRRDQGEQRVILINGNYHTDIPQEEQISGVQRMIGRWSDRCCEFIELGSQILGIES